MATSGSSASASKREGGITDAQVTLLRKLADDRDYPEDFFSWIAHVVAAVSACRSGRIEGPPGGQPHRLGLNLVGP